jgi:hypothetical protein
MDLVNAKRHLAFGSSFLPSFLYSASGLLDSGLNNHQLPVPMAALGVAQCRPLRSSAAHASADMQINEKANKYTAYHTTGIPLAQSHIWSKLSCRTLVVSH